MRGRKDPGKSLGDLTKGVIFGILYPFPKAHHFGNQICEMFNYVEGNCHD